MAIGDPLDLDEPGEWWGLWWLPEDPDQQVPGILRYSPDDGPLLSLIGAFEDRVMWPFAVKHGRSVWPGRGLAGRC